MVKCEKRETEETKREPGMIWEILSLSVLQKTLKLDYSLWGNCALERKPRMWLDDLLLMSWKNQKVGVQLHRGLFKETRSVTHSPQWSQQKSGIEVGLSKKALWQTLDCLMVYNSPWHTCETHKVFENVIPVETLPTWMKCTEKGWNERRLLNSQNPTGRKEADKVTQLKTCMTLTLWEKGRMTLRVGLRAEPQATEDHSQASKPEFAQLDSEIAWDQWLPFTSISSSFRG